MTIQKSRPRCNIKGINKGRWRFHQNHLTKEGQLSSFSLSSPSPPPFRFPFHALQIRVSVTESLSNSLRARATVPSACNSLIAKSGHTVSNMGVAQLTSGQWNIREHSKLTAASRTWNGILTSFPTKRASSMVSPYKVCQRAPCAQGYW